MIEQLIGEHPWMLLPLAAIIGLTYCVKGAFSMYGSFSQKRKDFLESWQPERVGDNLWLEMVIRQTFGTFIPADVIRPLLSKPGCAKALLEVASSWRFIKYENGDVIWAGRVMRTARRRWWGIAFVNTMYFASGSLAGLLFIALMQDMSSASLWIWFGGSLFCAFVSLSISTDVSAASKHLPRYLGLP